MNMNEHIQYLADHAAFLCSLSRLSNQTDEMKKLMKSSAEAALKAAGTILSMMEDEERKSSNPEPKKPEACTHLSLKSPLSKRKRLPLVVIRQR